jgi:hypothetical protein
VSRNSKKTADILHALNSWWQVTKSFVKHWNVAMAPVFVKGKVVPVRAFKGVVEAE